jgi:peptide/nickel transport system substrate-binding protein
MRSLGSPEEYRRALMRYPAGSTGTGPVRPEMPTVSEDGKTYTFTLRDNLMYADGTPVTAQDFVRSFDRLSLEGQVSGLVQAYVDSVEAPDDQTVVYHLKDSYGFFPALAAAIPSSPLHLGTSGDDEIVQVPETLPGYGPYQMTSHAGRADGAGSQPNYFGEDKPQIQKVIIRYFADPTTRSRPSRRRDRRRLAHLGPGRGARLEGVAETLA